MTKKIQVNDETFCVADKMEEIQLCEAVKNKESNEVKKLLLFYSSFLTDMVTPDIETLVGVAVRNQDLETLKILLHYGFQANMWGKDQITPIGYAAAEGYIEILQELLPIFKQYKMLINKCHILKDTPFSEAIKHGHLEAAKLLKEYGAAIGTTSKKSHMDYAQKSNSPEMMEYCRSLDNQRLEIEKQEFENLYLAAAKQGDITLCHTLEEKNITKFARDKKREFSNRIRFV
jgi:ankyrin repeat protein